MQMATRRQEESRSKGEPPEPWPYNGEDGAARLDADVEAARSEFQKAANEALNAEMQKLATFAAGFRVKSLAYEDAAHWFEIWKRYSQQQARQKGADETKKRAKKRKTKSGQK